MKWEKIMLETTTGASDLVIDMLLTLGIDGVEIQNNVPLSEEDKARMFIDILPELPPDEGKATLVFYTEPERDLLLLQKEIEHGLSELSDFIDVGTGNLLIQEVDEDDWKDNWKQFFQSFRVDENIVIKPTWDTVCDRTPQDLVIEIDPGTAFGTGAHETTKLCILNLKKYLKKGDTLLDLGCGSGILSIIGTKLGASVVNGTDIDENAVRVSEENAKINQTDGVCSFYCLNILDDDSKCPKPQGGYQVVVANILADVIIPLAKIVPKYLQTGGYFISSGIIENKAEPVRKALIEAGFTITEELWMKDWVSFTAQKTAGDKL